MELEISNSSPFPHIFTSFHRHPPAFRPEWCLHHSLIQDCLCEDFIGNSREIQFMSTAELKNIPDEKSLCSPGRLCGSMRQLLQRVPAGLLTSAYHQAMNAISKWLEPRNSLVVLSTTRQTLKEHGMLPLPTSISVCCLFGKFQHIQKHLFHDVFLCFPLLLATIKIFIVWIFSKAFAPAAVECHPVSAANRRVPKDALGKKKEPWIQNHRYS